MACAITKGRKVPCKSAFGGIKTVYFCNYGDATITALDSSTGEVETITMASSTKFQQYDVKGKNRLEISGFNLESGMYYFQIYDRELKMLSQGSVLKL